MLLVLVSLFHVCGYWSCLLLLLCVLSSMLLVRVAAGIRLLLMLFGVILLCVAVAVCRLRFSALLRFDVVAAAVFCC